MLTIHVGVCRTIINRFCAQRNNTGSSRDRPTSKSIHPVDLGQHPPQLAKFLDNNEFLPKSLSVVYVRLVFKQGDLCDARLSRHIISLNDFGGVQNVHSGEQFSLTMNLVYYCSWFECFWICRRHNERYAVNCVMAWARIHHDGGTSLSRVKGAPVVQIYRDEILQHYGVPWINVTGGIFQHDNARQHTAQVCRDLLQQNNIPVLPWPARWADLSPVEHLWDMMDSRVRQRNPSPQTLQELFLAFQNEWQNIPTHTRARTIQNLVASMHRLWAAVIATRGGHNR